MAVNYKTTSRANPPAGAQAAPKVKRSVLATACVLAVGGAFSGGAMAQSSIYGHVFGVLALGVPVQTITPTAYVDTITNNQANLANVTSLSTAVNIGLTVVNGTPTATPGTTTNNKILATSGSNQATNFIELNLLTNSGTDEGQGILSGQVTGTNTTDDANGTRIRADVSNSATRIVETGTVPAPLILSGNQLAAATTINSVASTIGKDTVPPIPAGVNTGMVPAGGFVSANNTTGDILFNADATATGTLSQGSLNIGNNQTALNSGSAAGSRARVTNSTVLLDLNATSGSVLSSPLTVTDNSLTASYTANNASGIIQTEAGGGAFTGSAVVTNAQSNTEELAASGASTARVSDSRVDVDIRSGVAATTELTSTLVVTGNTVSAGSTGNAAGARNAAGTILAGNAIIFSTSGADITGTGSDTTNLLDNLGGAQNAVMQGDLLVMSGQANNTTLLESVVQDSDVRVRADFITGGSIVNSSNTIASRTTGNLAGNLISATTTGNFNAGTAAGNLQINNTDATSNIMARTANSVVRVNVGTDVADAIEGSVTLNQNRVTSTAEGSAASTAVQISATNLTTSTAGPTSRVLGSNVTAEGETNAATGTSAGNVQTNLGAGTISSDVTDGAVILRADITTLVAGLMTNGNTISSGATGNSASTSVSLAGSQGVNVEAGVASAQVNQVTVSGSVNGTSGVRINTIEADGATMTANTNTVAAAATGNSATNGTTANFTTLVAGTGYDGSQPTASSDFSGQANSYGALGLVNGQMNTAAISSSNLTDSGYTIIRAGQSGVGGVDGSALTANSNVGSAATTGNSAGNQLTITASTIDTNTDLGSQIAGLVNTQVNLLAGAASATVGNNAATGPLIGIEVRESLTNSVATVNENAMFGTVVGNTATNGLSVTAANLSSAAPAGYAIAPGTISTVGLAPIVQGEFALLNQQYDEAVSRSATVQLGTIGITTAGVFADLSDSDLSVQRNSIVGDARNNNAANTAALVGFANLATTAGVMNDQAAATPVTSTVTGTVFIQSTPVGAPVAGTDMAVTDNTLRALSAGNIASSGLTVQATNLAGNSDLTGGSGSSVGPLVLTVNADFGVGNSQVQGVAGPAAVSATVNSSVRIDLTGSDLGAASTATVTGNRVQGIAQANSASNTLAVTSTNGSGLTLAVASSQLTDSNVSATQAVDGASLMSFGLLALTSAGNPVTVTNNSVTLTAGHNEAVNRMTVAATNLSGGGAAASPGSSYDTPSTTNTVNTDFSVSNLQNALGLTTVTATPALTGANIGTTITGGTLTVTGNSVNANAKTNSATNELAVNATNIAAPSAAVVNGQSADGAVSSTQALAGPATFGVLAGTSSTGAALTVSSNVINVTARQNDASSSLNVTSANVSGSTAGTGLTSYDPVTGVATSGAAYSVLNVQSGTGAVSASATPGVIGTVIGIIDAGSVTVNSNSVTAKADVNNAANALNLAASSTVSATGAINNVQTTSATAVSGTVNGGYVGVNSGTVLSPDSLTVQGNSLASQAGGNSATNVLNGTAGSSLASSANNPTLLVLNYQSNLASATALTTGSTVGVTGFTSLTGTPTAIVGNTLSAVGYGNTSTNQLGMSVLSGGLNQATAMVGNTQFNNGAIGATVTTATIGVGGGAVSGGSVVVSNNTAISQATANSAVNRIVGR